jgi:hypothetical protein
MLALSSGALHLLFVTCNVLPLKIPSPRGLI